MTEVDVLMSGFSVDTWGDDSRLWKPQWFTAGGRLYKNLVRAVSVRDDLLAVVMASEAPDEAELESLLDFLGDEFMSFGTAGPDWEVTPYGSMLEDLIDLVNGALQDLVDDEDE